MTPSGGPRRRPRGDEVEVAVDPVGDEGLAAGEPVVVAVLDRAGRQRRHVRSRPRLRDPERAHGVALDDGGQVLLLLRLRPITGEPGGGHVGVHQHAEGHPARSAARHLLAQHHARQEVPARASVLRRELQAEEPQLAQSPPELPRDPPRLLPLGDVRRDLFLHEGAHALAQQVVLGREHRDHWITSSARRRSDCGTVRPRAFAALRLMTVSNFEGCSTGRAAGLAPFRILSTKTPARRQMSTTSAP